MPDDAFVPCENKPVRILRMHTAGFITGNRSDAGERRLHLAGLLSSQIHVILTQGKGLVISLLV